MGREYPFFLVTAMKPDRTAVRRLDSFQKIRIPSAQQGYPAEEAEVVF
jgi:hypothetical protein